MSLVSIKWLGHHEAIHLVLLFKIGDSFCNFSVLILNLFHMLLNKLKFSLKIIFHVFVTYLDKVNFVIRSKVGKFAIVSCHNFP